MKPLFYKFLFAFFALISAMNGFCQTSTKTFKLSGTLQNIKILPKFVYLRSMEKDEMEFKVPVVNGRYVVSGRINGPTKFNILPIYAAKAKRPQDAQTALFIHLDAGSILLSHVNKFSNFKSKGSAVQRDFELIQLKLNQNLQAGISKKEANEIWGDFIKAYPRSDIAVYAIREYATPKAPKRTVSFADIPFNLANTYLGYMGRMEYDKAQPLFKALNEKLTQSDAGLALANEIAYANLDKQAEPFMVKLDSLIKLNIAAKKEGDAAKASGTENQMMAVQKELNKKVYEAYILKHPGSGISFDILERLSGSNFDDPELDNYLFEKLSPAIKKDVRAIAFKRRLDVAIKSSIGRMATEFTQPDSAGKLTSLASLRGKYVLVDFWASWCGPCRAENPNMVKIYNAYHDKGFTIISVSIDTEREQWLKAVKDDKLPWIQVSDLKRENQAAKIYEIFGIPANLLIGPDGKIVGKNLFGDILGQRVAELINPSNQ